MTPAPWRLRLDRALARNPEPTARYVQVATVRPGGRPANRTLVFRGFRTASDDLLFTVDWRSAKVAEVERHPWGAVCWYFPTTHEQFRLTGRLDVIGAADEGERAAERHRVWAELSDAARQQFGWPMPGADRAPDEAFLVPPTDPRTPLLSFAVLTFAAEDIDHLELAAPPQRRTLIRLRDDGAWEMREINP